LQVILELAQFTPSLGHLDPLRILDECEEYALPRFYYQSGCHKKIPA
jgi:hypothetical protein